MKNTHPSTRMHAARKEYTCEKCLKNIKIGEKYFKTNAKFVKPFHRCASCKPTKDEINEMFIEQMQDFSNGEFQYEDL